MRNESQQKFERELTAWILKPDGKSAAAMLPDEPAGRFGEAFNRLTQEIDAEFIDRVYERTLATLASKIDRRSVPGVDSLISLMHSVLGWNALHYRILSYHRANPRVVFQREVDGLKFRESVPLFVAGVDCGLFTGQVATPMSDTEQRELFAVLLSEARWLGPLRLRLFLEVRLFDWRQGTSFGAFQSVARRAILDERQRVVRLHRKASDDAVVELPPSPAVVRQVRNIYREACEILEQRAYFLGYRIKSVL